MNDEQLHAAAGEPGNNAAGNGGTTALRIFEQANGMNDFPVLKAFQEYIEAEQARARKRTLGLSIFFVVLLIVVVVTFSVIMAAVINRDQQSLQAIATRNQALSDKLLDIALRERTPAAQPVVNVQQPPSAAHPDAGAQALKPVLDRLESLTEALKKQPPAAAPQPAAQPAAAQPPLPVAVSPELDAARRQQDELARQRAAVAAERARLKEEQEQLRRDRIEQHRRRLYPEHYAREDAQRSAAEVPPPPAPAPVATPKPVVQPKPAPVAPPPKPKAVEAPAVDLKTAKPISYFDEAEAAPKPEPKKIAQQAEQKKQQVEQKKVSQQAEQKKQADGRTEVLNVPTKDGEAIPWLIELPEGKEK